MGREPATHFAGLAAPWSIPGLLHPALGPWLSLLLPGPLSEAGNARDFPMSTPGGLDPNPVRELAGLCGGLSGGQGHSGNQQKGRGPS